MVEVRKITKQKVDGLDPAEKPFIEFGWEIPGFGVRVAPGGQKTFILEYRPGGGGRSVAKRRLKIGEYGPMTAEQARKKASDEVARIRLDPKYDPQEAKQAHREAPTVAALVETFLTKHVETKLKAKTAKEYAAVLERLRAAHGTIKAEALTRAHVAAIHTSMATTPYQANRFRSAVSSLFAWAVEGGALPEGHPNPASRVRPYKERRKERFLTNEELGRLGDALREAETIGLPWRVDEGKAKAKHLAAEENRRTRIDPYAVAAIRLLILTGARLNEILKARWKWVDFERAIIFLPDSKTDLKPIYLSPAALEILAALPRVENNPYVFPGDKAGAPRADLNRPWAGIKRAASLEGVRAHDLRHSFASIGAGVSLGLPIIGRLLGHAQASTTQRYAHVAADPAKSAADAISSSIAAAMDGDRGTIVPLRKASVPTVKDENAEALAALAVSDPERFARWLLDFAEHERRAGFEAGLKAGAAKAKGRVPKQARRGAPTKPELAIAPFAWGVTQDQPDALARRAQRFLETMRAGQAVTGVTTPLPTATQLVTTWKRRKSI